MSGVTKWIISQSEKLPMFKKIVGKSMTKSIMTASIDIQDLRGLPYIKKFDAINLINSAFNNKYGGLFVIIAPPGSGKSTYLRNCCNQFIQSGGHVRYLSSDISTRAQFYEAFGGIDRSSDLFNVMPPKSVIVLDQIEKLYPLSFEMKGLLGHLAVESRRVAEKNIVVSVSSINCAKEILSLNGYDKIQQVGHCQDFMWHENQIDEFLCGSIFSNLTSEQKMQIRDRAITAACPGFLYTVADRVSSGYPKNDSLLKLRAEQYQKTWSDFCSVQF